MTTLTKDDQNLLSKAKTNLDLTEWQVEKIKHVWEGNYEIYKDRSLVSNLFNFLIISILFIHFTSFAFQKCFIFPHPLIIATIILSVVMMVIASAALVWSHLLLKDHINVISDEALTKENILIASKYNDHWINYANFLIPLAIVLNGYVISGITCVVALYIVVKETGLFHNDIKKHLINLEKINKER